MADKSVWDDDQFVHKPYEPPEVMEQDTTDIEDVPDLLSIIIPPGTVPDNCGQLGIFYNRKVFNGWVKQPSPCCGAASVAGAWNALSCFHRKDELAVNHTHVLDIYISMFEDLISKKKTTFERKLGAPLELLMTRLQKEFTKLGKQIGGAKAIAVTKKDLTKCITALAMERYKEKAETKQECMRPGTAAAAGVGTDGGADESPSITAAAVAAEDMAILSFDAVDCVIDLLKIDGFSFETEQPPDAVDATVAVPVVATNAAAPASDPPIANANDDHNSDEDEVEDEDVAAQPSSKKSGKAAKWDWKTELFGIIKSMAGITKLSHPTKANTAAIGNWGITEATRLLSESRGLGTYVTCRLFMGKKKTVKSKVDVPLSHKDDEHTITTQWDALRAHFGRADTVLLFHLKNHYALIFALREWVEYRDVSAAFDTASVEESVKDAATHAGNGAVPVSSLSSKAMVAVTVRQILTTRRGQRPSAWIDFAEARQTMIGWEGYKIMAISAKDIALSALQTQVKRPTSSGPPNS